MIAEMLGKNVEFVFKNDFSNTHYMITPYSFSPRLGRKMIPPVQIDLGQGVLHIIEAIHNDMNPDMQNFSGLLVKDQP